MLSAMLDKTVQHQRQSAVKDSIGGNTPTWATQNADVKAAIWPAGSSTVRGFGRRDIVGTHMIATDRNLSATTKDRFSHGGVYYVVNGVEPYSNAGVTTEVLYLHDVTLRTV
jgi:hypothetical protein